MANIMQRKFTLRERILIIILVGVLLVGLYFFLVFYPVQNRLKDLEQENEALTLKEDVAKIREARYDSMKAELEEIAKMDPNEVTEIPKFNNLNRIILIIDSILEQIGGSVNPDTISGESSGNIYVRTVPLNFTVSGFESEEIPTNYAKTKSVIYALTHIEYKELDKETQQEVVHRYRSQMSNLTISGSGNVTTGESLTISCNLIFYERQA